MAEEHTTVVHLVGCVCELCEARAEIDELRRRLARAAEMVRVKDDLITEMQRRLIAHDMKVPKLKEAKK